MNVDLRDDRPHSLSMSALGIARGTLVGSIAMYAAVIAAGYAELIDPMGAILLCFVAVVGMASSSAASLLLQALGRSRR